jgi:hypothetical protein
MVLSGIVVFSPPGGGMIDIQKGLEIRARVGTVHQAEGYVVAYVVQGTPELTNGEDVTFSLTLWQGERLPVKNQIVVLDDVELFSKGWRAQKALPVSATRNPDPQTKVQR